MASDQAQPPPQKGDQHRQLRVVAICAFVPALALLLPCGIISARPLPAIGIAPMFFSAGFQVLTINGTPRLPKTTVCVNLLIALFLFSILVPSWIFMAQGGLSYWGGDGLTMVGAYGTMPLMINFVIHLYLAQRTFLSISCCRRSVSGSCCCSCCCSSSGCSGSDRIETFAGKGNGDYDVHQPMIGFYDNDDGRDSGEYQTSGFNTPRVSQETLESSGRLSGDLA